MDQCLQNEDFCFKVAQFYSKSQDTALQQLINSSENNPDNDQHFVSIPNLDNKDQNKERRELLLKGVNKSFNEVNSRFGVNRKIWTEIVKLVKTFQLTAENVFVEPSLNQLLLIVLMRMVSDLKTIVHEKDWTAFEMFCISEYKKYGYSDLNELENFVQCFWKIE